MSLDNHDTLPLGEAVATTKACAKEGLPTRPATHQSQPCLSPVSPTQEGLALLTAHPDREVYPRACLLPGALDSCSVASESSQGLPSPDSMAQSWLLMLIRGHSSGRLLQQCPPPRGHQMSPCSGQNLGRSCFQGAVLTLNVLVGTSRVKANAIWGHHCPPVRGLAFPCSAVGSLWVFALFWLLASLGCELLSVQLHGWVSSHPSSTQHCVPGTQLTSALLGMGLLVQAGNLVPLGGLVWAPPSRLQTFGLGRHRSPL